MTKQIELRALEEQSLLKGLSSEQLIKVREFLIEESFPPNSVILEEESSGEDLYLIKDGEVNVLKWDEDHCTKVLLGKLSKGDVFGEMSFMDKSARSSMIKTIKKTTVFRLPSEVLSNESMKGIEIKILSNIATININRLRLSNKLYVKNVQNYQRLMQDKQYIGKFLLFQYLLLGFCVILSQLFTKEVLTFMPWLLALIPLCMMITLNEYTWQRFGINLREWPKTLITTLIIIAISWILAHLLKSFFSLPYSFYGKNLLFDSAFFTSIFLLFYSFSQEFIARGIMQSSLQEFLDDQNGYKSVFFNACFLFVLFMPLGTLFAFNIFLVSLPMGFLYAKQRTVFGVFLLHYFLLELGIIQV